jgi:hypothetical protein
MGLKSDGSIATWGSNEFGQLDVPPPNAGFVAIAAGFGHNVGLKADGSIVAWGRDNWGQHDVPLPIIDIATAILADTGRSESRRWTSVGPSLRMAESPLGWILPAHGAWGGRSMRSASLVSAPPPRRPASDIFSIERHGANAWWRPSAIDASDTQVKP